MAPTTKSKSSLSKAVTLKQATLGFSSVKRSSSLNTELKGKKSKSQGELRQASSLQIADASSSDSEDEITPTLKPSMRPQSKTGRAKNLVIAQPAEDETPQYELLDYSIHDKDKRWNNHYMEVKRKSGFLPQIHAEKEMKVHHILRVFDLSYEYGPCFGVSRLERWERAQAMGLHPPQEVREILLAKDAKGRNDIHRDVFYGSGI